MSMRLLPRPLASIGASRARSMFVLASVLAATAVGASCRAGERVTAPDEDPNQDTTLAVPMFLRAIPLATYDGSGQAVHPDYAAPIRPWSHRPRYLAITPYPNSNIKFENPALYSGADGMNWSVAKGTPNPIAYPKGGYGYLSDPDVVYANLHNELFLYFRQVSDSDRVYLTRSSNGVMWSDPQQVVGAGLNAALSPAVVRRASGDWYMFTVLADSGCRGPSAVVDVRRSADGVTWSAPAEVAMDLRGYSPWHLDVQWIPSREEFWALVPVKTPGTCATRQLFLSTSPDGVHWTTLPNAVARAGESAEFRDVIYRSTFAYDATTDQVTFWYSGARLAENDSWVWSTSAIRRPRSDVFALAKRAAVLTPSERRREVDELFQPPE